MIVERESYRRDAFHASLDDETHRARVVHVDTRVVAMVDTSDNHVGLAVGKFVQCHLDAIDGCTRATVYGDAEILPVTELTPRKPATSPYGNTKQMAEDILRDMVSATEHLNGIALRYFNPIGAHPSALIGELPRGVPNNLVPFVTQTAAGIRECLSIFGDDYSTPDGSCLRDYIDVVDLARAHVVAIARMAEGKSKERYEVFNVGTGSPVSVFELVKGFEEANNLKLNYKVAPRRAGDVMAVWADTTLANNELGWKAERKLSDTLKSAWAWEKNLRGIE